MQKQNKFIFGVLMVTAFCLLQAPSSEALDSYLATTERSKEGTAFLERLNKATKERVE